MRPAHVEQHVRKFHKQTATQLRYVAIYEVFLFFIFNFKTIKRWNKKNKKLE